MKLTKRIGKVISLKFVKGIGWVDGDINTWQFAIELQTKNHKFILEFIKIRFD